MNIKKAIKEYQCSGCVSGSSPYNGCFGDSNTIGVGCAVHCAGTSILGLGRVFLGLPKGFNRMGDSDRIKVTIFENFENKEKQWKYDMTNVPVCLDEHGNTLVWSYRKKM